MILTWFDWFNVNRNCSSQLPWIGFHQLLPGKKISKNERSVFNKIKSKKPRNKTDLEEVKHFQCSCKQNFSESEFTPGDQNEGAFISLCMEMGLLLDQVKEQFSMLAHDSSGCRSSSLAVLQMVTNQRICQYHTRVYCSHQIRPAYKLYNKHWPMAYGRLEIYRWFHKQLGA